MIPAFKGKVSNAARSAGGATAAAALQQFELGVDAEALHVKIDLNSLGFFHQLLLDEEGQLAEGMNRITGLLIVHGKGQLLAAATTVDKYPNGFDVASLEIIQNLDLGRFGYCKHCLFLPIHF